MLDHLRWLLDVLPLDNELSVAVECGRATARARERNRPPSTGETGVDLLAYPPDLRLTISLGSRQFVILVFRWCRDVRGRCGSVSWVISPRRNIDPGR